MTVSITNNISGKVFQENLHVQMVLLDRVGDKLDINCHQLLYRAAYRHSC